MQTGKTYAYGSSYDNPSASAGAWLDITNLGTGLVTLKYGNVVVNGGISHSNGVFTPTTTGLFRVFASAQSMTYSTTAEERNVNFGLRGSSNSPDVCISYNAVIPTENNAHSVRGLVEFSRSRRDATSPLLITLGACSSRLTRRGGGADVENFFKVS